MVDKASGTLNGLCLNIRKRKGRKLIFMSNCDKSGIVTFTLFILPYIFFMTISQVNKYSLIQPVFLTIICY